MMPHIRDEVANPGGPGSPSTSKIDDGFDDDAGLESLLASVLSGELSVLGANPQTLPGMSISADSDELTPRSTPGDILSRDIGIKKMSSPRGSSLLDEDQIMDEDARMGSGVRELDRRPAEVSGRPPARLSDPATDAVSGSSRPDVRDASASLEARQFSPTSEANVDMDQNTIVTGLSSRTLSSMTEPGAPTPRPIGPGETGAPGSPPTPRRGRTGVLTPDAWARDRRRMATSSQASDMMLYGAGPRLPGARWRQTTYEQN